MDYVWLIFDIASLVIGLGFIILPNKMFAWMIKEEDRRQPGKHWWWISRLIGLAFVAFGVLNLWTSISAVLAA